MNLPLIHYGKIVPEMHPHGILGLRCDMLHDLPQGNTILTQRIEQVTCEICLSLLMTRGLLGQTTTRNAESVE